MTLPRSGDPMPGERPPLTRRAAMVAAAGAASAGALALAPEIASAAGTSNLYVVVDPAGGGDYTSLEQAVSEAPEDCTIFVRHGLHAVTGASGARGALNPKAGVRIIGEGYGSH